MPNNDGRRDMLPVNIAVMTVSDSRTEADDKSGQTLVDRIVAAGHNVVDRKIVRDEHDDIAAQLRRWIDDAMSTWSSPRVAPA